MSLVDALWNWGRYNYLKVLLNNKDNYIKIIEKINLSKDDKYKEFIEAYRLFYAEIVWSSVTPLVEKFYGDADDKDKQSDYNLVKNYVLNNKKAWLSKFNKKKSDGKYEINFEFKSEIAVLTRMENDGPFSVKNFNRNNMRPFLNMIYVKTSISSFSLSLELLSTFMTVADFVVIEALEKINATKGKYSVKKESLDDLMFRQKEMPVGMEKMGLYRGHYFGSIYEKGEDLYKRLLNTYKMYDSLWGVYAINNDLDPQKVLHGIIGVVCGCLLIMCCCSMIIIVLKKK
jgi:hypothetical protein